MKTGRQFRLSILVFLLSLAAAPSYAEMYVSGALSFNDHSQSNIDDAGGYTLGIGYRPERGWLGGELSYIDAGDANISGLGTLEMSGASASAVFWIQGEEADATGMSGNIKLGVYSMTATVASSTADSKGYRLGMGFEFKINNHLGWYTDLDGYFLVDATNDNEDNLAVLSLGLRYYF